MEEYKGRQDTVLWLKWVDSKKVKRMAILGRKVAVVCWIWTLDSDVGIRSICTNWIPHIITSVVKADCCPAQRWFKLNTVRENAESNKVHYKTNWPTLEVNLYCIVSNSQIYFAKKVAKFISDVVMLKQRCPGQSKKKKINLASRVRISASRGLLTGRSEWRHIALW